MARLTPIKGHGLNTEDVFLDAAAVEDGVDDLQDELNAAAEMFAVEMKIVPANEGHGVDFSVPMAAMNPATANSVCCCLIVCCFSQSNTPVE